MWGCSVIAEAALLVLLIFAIVAGEEFDMRITLKGEDMRGDAVEEPAIMRDHEHVAGKFEQGVFKRAQGFNIEIV